MQPITNQQSEDVSMMNLPRSGPGFNPGNNDLGVANPIISTKNTVGWTNTPFSNNVFLKEMRQRGLQISLSI